MTSDIKSKLVLNIGTDLYANWFFHSIDTTHIYAHVLKSQCDSSNTGTIQSYFFILVAKLLLWYELDYNLVDSFTFVS